MYGKRYIGKCLNGVCIILSMIKQTIMFAISSGSCKCACIRIIYVGYNKISWLGFCAYINNVHFVCVRKEYCTLIHPLKIGNQVLILRSSQVWRASKVRSIRHFKLKRDTFVWPQTARILHSTEFHNLTYWTFGIEYWS